MILLAILLILAFTTGLFYMTPSERVYKIEPIKRPVIITIICIIGLLGSLGGFIFVFSPFIRKIGDWIPAIYGIIIAVKFISFIGVWHMKKWGVHLFLFSFFSDVVFGILIDNVSYIGIFFGLLYITFFLIFYRRMAEEL
jgi:hypothetical protein